MEGIRINYIDSDTWIDTIKVVWIAPNNLSNRIWRLVFFFLSVFLNTQKAERKKFFFHNSTVFTYYHQPHCIYYLTMARQNFVGVVISQGKMTKTVKVRVQGRVYDKRVDKEILTRKDYLVHDEGSICKEGDIVRIESIPKISKKSFCYCRN